MSNSYAMRKTACLLDLQEGKRRARPRLVRHAGYGTGLGPELIGNKFAHQCRESAIGIRQFFENREMVVTGQPY